jgi:hypothetical protein
MSRPGRWRTSACTRQRPSLTVSDIQPARAAVRRFALARVLVAAGVSDQPVRVTQKGLRGHMSYRSLYRMAELTIKESATCPVRPARFEERPAFSVREASKWG